MLSHFEELAQQLRISFTFVAAESFSAAQLKFKGVLVPLRSAYGEEIV